MQSIHMDGHESEQAFSCQGLSFPTNQLGLKKKKNSICIQLNCSLVHKKINLIFLKLD